MVGTCNIETSFWGSERATYQHHSGSKAHFRTFEKKWEHHANRCCDWWARNKHKCWFKKRRDALSNEINLWSFKDANCLAMREQNTAPDFIPVSVTLIRSGPSTLVKKETYFLGTDYDLLEDSSPLDSVIKCRLLYQASHHKWHFSMYLGQ